MHTTFHDHAERYSGENALTLAEVSAATYLPHDELLAETKDCFELVQHVDLAGTTAVVLANASSAVVGFRGTELTLDDWRTNARLRKVPLVIGGVGLGAVHRGFREALAIVEEDVLTALAAPALRNRPLWLTGHSLGGALAMLLAVRLQTMGRPVHGLYTFGQPRVGDHAFASAVEPLLAGRHFRLVNGNDPVPRVPPKNLGYVSAGLKLLLGADGLIKPVTSWWQELQEAWAIAQEYWRSNDMNMLKAHHRDEYVRCLRLAYNRGFALPT